MPKLGFQKLKQSYKEPREFAGVVFKDERWGKNYAPYDRSFASEESVLFQIRDTLRENL